MEDKTLQIPFTFRLTRAERDLLFDYAESQGLFVGECLRRIIAEKFAQLQQKQP